MLVFKSFNPMNNISYDQQLVKLQPHFSSLYSTQPPQILTVYNSNVSHPSVINGQFMNDLVRDGFRRHYFRPQQNSGEHRRVNVKYTEWLTIKMLKTNSVLPSSIGSHQHAFPFHSLLAYQAHVGPLNIPPFVFNCAAQPSCALPIPPPLPDMALNFRNSMECNGNSLNIYPFTSIWQTSEPTIPSYSSIPQTPPNFNSGYPYIQQSPLPSWNKPVENNALIPYRLDSSLELPPGGILLIDEYIDQRETSRGKHHRRKHRKRMQRINQLIEQSMMINTNNSHWIQSKEILPKNSKRDLFNHSKNTPALRVLHGLSNNTIIQPEKISITSINENENVNLSSDSDALRDIRLSLASRDNQIVQHSSLPTVSSIDETKVNTSSYPSSLRSVSKTIKSVSIVESDITKQSLSTFRPNSRSTLLST